MTRRTVSAVAIALALQAVGATAARADGLPVLGFTGGTRGVRSLDGTRRYLARPRRHETIVRAVTTSGRTQARAALPGRFDVPVVAYDGSASGLSANGRTLVLIRPRTAFPQRSTELAVLSAPTLHPLRFERLRGDFSFDAISPGGEWIYLIQYTSRFDPTRYRVRALSARTGHLLARDIVDPRNRSEAMRGNPITRVSSADGRWAYTLYDGNGQPFVHALDTARLTARCIDVAAFPTNVNPWQARLTLSGERLDVALEGQTLTEIDTKSLSLIALTRAAGAKTAKSQPSEGSNTVPIAVGLLLLAGAGAGAILTVTRRGVAPPRRSRVP